MNYVPKTILLVEDFEDTRNLMRYLLETVLGYRVIEAVDGCEAVELAKKEHPDLILIDIAMPIMDGITATGLIKQCQELAEVPIVALTAMDSESQIEALKVGATQVLQKPVNLEKLKPFLTQYLVD